ncbi:MAG: GNAT family N-acetyltransferase, partial [Cyanobacteria bacterium P01_H01_bin.58]
MVVESPLIELLLTMHYAIRLAVPADIPLLPAIERAAAVRFACCLEATGLTPAMLTEVNAIANFEQAQQREHLWVATDSHEELVGFAMVLEVGSYAHLEELDVLPDHGRQGIGAALLATVCAWAKEQNYPAITLRTFSNVAWNQPFYERHGFRVIDSAKLSAAHTAIAASEQQQGLCLDHRVSM